MKIDRIRLKNFFPLGTVELNELSSFVVVVGPNGIGKSRLAQLIRQSFNTDSERSIQISLDVSATSEHEETAWSGRKQLCTDDRVEGHLIRTTTNIVGRRTFGALESTFIWIQPGAGALSQDPDGYDAKKKLQEQMLLPISNTRLGGSLNILIGAIKYHHQILQIRDNLINAGYVKSSGLQDVPDPVNTIEELFNDLFSPEKTFVRNKPSDMTQSLPNSLKYNEGGHELSLANLSAGEMHIFGILLQIEINHASNCIFIMDEPELHLHPTLARRFARRLHRLVDRKNQFILFTHSAEIAGEAIGSTLVLLRREAESTSMAITMNAPSVPATVSAFLGKHFSSVTMRKCICVCEGNLSSLDALIFEQLVSHQRLPIQLMPLGNREIVTDFMRGSAAEIEANLGDRRFFAIIDRDYANLDENGRRVFLLKRYSIESYLFDEEIIYEVAKEIVKESERMERPHLRSSAAINERLKSLAARYQAFAVVQSVETLLRKKMPSLALKLKNINGASVDDAVREAIVLADAYAKAAINLAERHHVETLLEERREAIRMSLDDPLGRWKLDLPLKRVISEFVNQDIGGIDVRKFATLYVRKTLEKDATSLLDIQNILSNASSSS